MKRTVRKWRLNALAVLLLAALAVFGGTMRPAEASAKSWKASYRKLVKKEKAGKKFNLVYINKDKIP